MIDVISVLFFKPILQILLQMKKRPLIHSGLKNNLLFWYVEEEAQGRS